MRRLIVLASLSMALAAPLPAQETPPGKPLYRFPGLPEAPVPGPAQRNSGPRGQLFVSPAGEPFRAEPGTPYPVVTWFAQTDGDHDGRIDRTEFAADFDRFFDVIDINHDGVVDPAEVKRYEREVVPEVAAGDGFGPGFGPGPGGGRPRRGGPRLAIAGSGNGSGRGGAGQNGDVQAPPPRRGDDQPILGAGRYGLINIPEPVSSTDINLDGSITRYEFRQAATRRFTLLDFDNRGVLRLADLPRTPAQRSGEGNRRRRDR